MLILKTMAIFLSTIMLITIATSIVSSQLVIVDIQSFGLEMTFIDRLSMTLKDILGLGPILSMIIGTSFLIAIIIAKIAHQFIGGNRDIWYISAGLSSVPLTLLIIKYILGITLLAAARTPLGMLLVACCSAVGGWLFAYLTNRYIGVKND